MTAIPSSAVNVFHFLPEPVTEAPQGIRATPLEWMDCAALPPRQWLYGGFLIRGHVAVTVAPGGTGKSVLSIVEALAMASGKPLLGTAVHERTPVWIYNLEDSRDELNRRVFASAKAHGLTETDLAGQLFLDSGIDRPICIATQSGKDGVKVCEETVAKIIATIRENRIGVMIVDPLVSSHRVAENDNGAMDAMVKTWTRIAHETGAAIHLVHHSRKSNGNETGMDDARGAVALIAAARSGRVLNVMTQEEATKTGIDGSRFRFVRIEDGKANLALRSDRADWFELVSVTLGNGTDGNLDMGDAVGVPMPWRWPDPFEDVTVADLLAAQRAVAEGGPWRASDQSPGWAGYPIMAALGIEPDEPSSKARVKALLKTWLRTGAFVQVDGKDERRKPVKMVEVGQWATE
jgi:hypothetical protein